MTDAEANSGTRTSEQPGTSMEWQQDLFRVLSDRGAVAERSSTSSRSGQTTTPNAFDLLIQNGMHGVARAVLESAHARGDAELCIMVGMLRMHAHTDVGLAQLLSLNSSDVRADGVLVRRSLLSVAVRVASRSVKTIASLETQRTKHLDSLESISAIRLCYVALAFSNDIKNRAFDLNLLGVLVTAQNRPGLQLGAVGTKKDVQTPLHDLATACVQTCVAVEKALRPFKRNPPSPPLSSSKVTKADSPLCTDLRSSVMFQSLLELGKFAMSVLREMVGIVAYQSEPQEGLAECLTHARVIQRPTSTSTKSGLKVSILPRFFQPISHTIDTIISEAERDPCNHAIYLELFKNLLPRTSTHGDAAWILATHWTHELAPLQDRLARLFCMLGSTCMRKLRGLVSGVLRGLLGLCCEAVKPGPAGNMYVSLVSRVMDQVQACMDGRDLFSGRLDVLRNWVLFLEETISGVEGDGFKCGVKVCLSIHVKLNLEVVPSDKVELCLSLVLLLIRWNMKEHDIMDCILLREIQHIINTLAAKTCHDDNVWNPQLETLFSFIVPVSAVNGNVALNKSLRVWLMGRLQSLDAFLSKNNPHFWRDGGGLGCVLCVMFTARRVPDLASVWDRVKAKLECGFQDEEGQVTTLLLPFKRLFANDHVSLRNLYQGLEASSAFAPVAIRTSFCDPPPLPTETFIRDVEAIFEKVKEPIPIQTPPMTPICMNLPQISHLQVSTPSSSSNNHQNQQLQQQQQHTPITPVVVFKQYSQNAFREMSSINSIPPHLMNPAMPPMPGMARTLSNTSRAPSVHVDTFQTHGPDAYQKQTINMHALSAMQQQQFQRQQQFALLQQQQQQRQMQLIAAAQQQGRGMGGVGGGGGGAGFGHSPVPVPTGMFSPPPHHKHGNPSKSAGCFAATVSTPTSLSGTATLPSRATPTPEPYASVYEPASRWTSPWYYAWVCETSNDAAPTRRDFSPCGRDTPASGTCTANNDASRSTKIRISSTAWLFSESAIFAVLERFLAAGEVVN
ncbi:hypothetical protein BC830DRAFT_1087640 [Chytriomyces sp. MP71]|nr:hypothetical protein BC830DRAFT_1087640 [Chytriomyces sp. MP71]